MSERLAPRQPFIQTKMPPKAQSKIKRRRGITYLWIAAMALLVFLLIYFEQTAILYIFSTLGVTILLVIVAMTDLGKTELSDNTQTPSPAVAKSRS